MRIGRTIPPAAAPIYLRDILNGLFGMLRGKSELDRFKTDVKKHFGVKHCFLVSSGTAALTLILKALNEMNPDRREVIIPAFCCYALPSAIIRAGLKIKLCDVNPDTLDFNYLQLDQIISEYKSHIANGKEKPAAVSNSNPEQAKRHVTGKQSEARLLAVVPVHLFGLPADIERLRWTVHDCQVTIVEDAAQVLGAKWNGNKLGMLGDVSFFSLGRGKALSTVEGGVILTDRDDIAAGLEAIFRTVSKYKFSELIRLVFKAIILTFFQHPALFWIPKSLPFLKVGDTFYDPNFKIREMTAFQAALARNWKNKLKKFRKLRKENSKHWSLLGKVNCLHKYCTKNSHIPDMLRFPIRITDSHLWGNILRESDKNGNGVMFTYPTSINLIDELTGMFEGLNYPVAEKLPGQLLTLPIHPHVTGKDIKKISKLFLRPKSN
jgi:dTDP-4-amino-4,6-dideoxygalactose transaminase